MTRGAPIVSSGADGPLAPPEAIAHARAARERGARPAILLAAGGGPAWLDEATEQCLVDQWGALAAFLPGDLERAVAFLERGVDPRAGVLLVGADPRAVSLAARSCAEAGLVVVERPGAAARKPLEVQVAPLANGPGSRSTGRPAGGCVALDWRDDPKATLRALALLGRALEAPPADPIRTPDPRRLAAARDIVWGPARWLSEPASVRAAAAYGIPVAQGILCETASACEAAFSSLGGPIVVKAASPDFGDKAGLGAVLEGVRTRADARRAFSTVTRAARRRAPQARLLGAWVAQSWTTDRLADVRAERHDRLGWVLAVTPRTAAKGSRAGAPARPSAHRILPLSAPAAAALADEATRGLEASARARRALSDLIEALSMFVVGLEDLLQAVALAPVALDATAGAGRAAPCIALDVRIRVSGPGAATASDEEPRARGRPTSGPRNEGDSTGRGPRRQRRAPP